MGKVNGQLILTEGENIAWIDKLRNEKELSEQLSMLRTRMLADTSVYVKNIGDRGIPMAVKDKKQELGLCRPMLIVESYIIQVSNDTDNKTVEDLTNELTTDRIKQLGVVDVEEAKALFGINGWCGVVLLTTKNKKSKKALLKYKI